MTMTMIMRRRRRIDVDNLVSGIEAQSSDDEMEKYVNDIISRGYGDERTK